jgi:hypothetical protein
MSCIMLKKELFSMIMSIQIKNDIRDNESW